MIPPLNPKCCLIEFGRGEVVDSYAMNEFVGHGNGRYVSNLPKVCFGITRLVIVSRLRGCNEEAEDAAVGFSFSINFAGKHLCTLLKVYLFSRNPMSHSFSFGNALFPNIRHLWVQIALEVSPTM